ncbi:MAG: aminotransferase class IV, partial [Myxococcota bacterium]
DAGADAALMLDTHGYVAEGAGENFFFVRDGKIITPEPSTCLNGITRDAIITLAREQGYEVVEKKVTRDEVYCADEAFFTGTAAEVMPIRSLDGRTIGAGRRGEVVKQLQTLFFDAARGRIEKHRDWLTPVAD